ncbi:crotonase/enoyl-CoA hydratase family protein [Chthonobacter albigriseus]|uniref:crotonase/enoyl-CoA hydratase family protein n=1 Tax=Chthonobacter albigriseus TaxID=1683161 RepID=UPI0015EF8E5A|nr:crotonase/enoyl-CoA hydratase family protein [Chthonobacter albigriseus]
MSALIKTEQDGGVLVIRIDRPEKKNALTADMYDALTSSLEKGARDGSVGAILLAGAPGAFTAGNDMKDFLAVAMTGQDFGGPVLSFLRALANAEKPLVAAVDGLAIGIGTTMLFHCDLVFASDQSVFRTPFTDLGLVPEGGSSLLGPKLMGHHEAFALLVAGEPFDAMRAKAAGFVNKVASPAAVEVEALAAAKALAAKPREAVVLARRLLRGGPADVLARIDEEARLFGERLKSSEARAAFEAFFAKRS